MMNLLLITFILLFLCGYKDMSCKVSNCFVAGTKVYTIQSFRNIEDLKKGDFLYSYNLNGKYLEEAEVIKTIARKAYEIYTIKAGYTTIKVTSEHPFYIYNKGWVKVSDLEVGDNIKTMYEEIRAITSITSTIETKTVYNITVSGNRNYFVSKNGFLVHNK